MEINKNKFIEKYKKLNIHNEGIKKNNISIFLLSFIINKESKILQIGDIDKESENYILSKIDDKNNYVKKENNHFNFNKYQNKYNIIFNTLIIGFFKKTYDFCIQFSGVYKQITYLYFYYNDRTKLCDSVRNIFVKNNFYNLLSYNIDFDDTSLINKGAKYKNKNKKIIYEILKKGNTKGELGNFLFSHGRNDISLSSIINHLINKFKCKSYLEIGVNDGLNFNKINIDYKIGIDPEPSKYIDNKHLFLMNSDEFFEYIDTELGNNIENNNISKNKNIENIKKKYDIIFIDGCKNENQILKDINNSLNHLNENGFILLKNCNPPNKIYVKKDYNNGNNNYWIGDAWMVYTKLRISNPNLLMYVLNCEFGLGLIMKGSQRNIKLNIDFNYSQFAENKEYYLNIISIYEFLSLF